MDLAITGSVQSDRTSQRRALVLPWLVSGVENPSSEASTERWPAANDPEAPGAGRSVYGRFSRRMPCRIFSMLSAWASRCIRMASISRSALTFTS